MTFSIFLLVGDLRLDLVEGALPQTILPLLHANGVVVREVASVGCDEGIGSHPMCDNQATAAEEAFPDFLT